MNMPATAVPAATPAPQESHLMNAFQAQCVLMKVSAFAPTKTRTSASATRDTHQKLGTSNGRYTAHVMLPDLSKGLNAATQRARRYLDNNSVQFGDYRLVRLTDYAEVRMKLSELAEQYVETVREATQDWPAYRSAVQEACEGLWSEDILPATQLEYLQECELRIQTIPLPAMPTHMALPAELAAQLEADIRAEIHEQYNDVLLTCKDDLAKDLDHIIARVEQTDKKADKSTFNRIRATVERLSKFNLTGDQTFGQVLATATQLLSVLDTKRFNDEDAYRATVENHLRTLRAHV